MNLDRFSRSLPYERDERRILFHCQGCNEPIYNDEEVTIWDGNVFHDGDCLLDYIWKETRHMTARDALREGVA